MVEELEEAKVLAGLDDEGLGVRVGEVDHRNSGEQGGRPTCLDEEDLV